MKNILQETFGSQKRWVNYRIVTMKGKKTKIPYFKKDVNASSTDEATWMTYDEAVLQADNGSNRFDGVGIVFTPAQDLLGIDIDHVLKDGKVDHAQKTIIAKLLKAANTYTEISPSGDGLHLFLSLSEPLALNSNKRAPYEAYTSGRYFTVTGNVYGKEKEVRTVSAKEALEIMAIIGYPWKEDTSEIVAPAQKDGSGRLDDETLLHKMFLSKNGMAINKLWNGDLSEYKNDASSADMALCSHLAFWSGRDPVQMERLWMQSPLGQREKTAERKDYRTRTIGNAISKCKEVYEIPKGQADEEDMELHLLYTLNAKRDKVYTLNTENIARVLRRHPQFSGRFRYDTFKNVLETRDDKGWRNLTDSDAIFVQTRISILFSFFAKVGKDMTFDAIVLVSRENSYDSARDFVVGLVWDKQERLDTWLTSVFNVEDNTYHRAVGSNWIKGLVSRIIYPGCKFDHVLVLEGAQGTKKSTSLNVLGDMGSFNLHVETTMSTDNKDFFMQFQGKAIIEFSEGETLSRTEVKRMKAIITTQSDKYRPAYGRTSEDFPRRCVFAMTTNQEEYLKDETGNRRWLPVACVGNANVEWLKENRDQIFAEAYHRLVTGKETIYEFPEEETREQQARRRVQDPNADLIADWYIHRATQSQRDDGITIQDVYSGAFLNNFSSAKGLDKYREMSIASVLRDVLKLTKKRKMVDNIQSVRWFDEEGKYSQNDLHKYLTTPIAVPDLATPDSNVNVDDIPF